MICILCVVFAFILILKGGDLLVESSIWFSKKANIPSLVVGATVVAIATTFPEVSVSIFSGIKGAETLAINTALGSMVCNFALVLGLAFLIAPSHISKSGLKKKLLFFLISIICVFLFALDQKLGLLDACLLFLIFIIYIVVCIIEARNKNIKETINKDCLPTWKKTIIQFVISAFAIGFGANVLVSNIENLSALLGISEGLLGVFVIAVGTNIPEFVTTMTAIKLKDSEIGIGNIFGASIIDSTMLIAVTVFAGQSNSIRTPIRLVMLTVPLLILITAIISIPVLRKEKSNRIQGFLLIILFLIYSIILTKIS